MGKILTIVLLLIVALLGLGFGWVSYKDKKALEARDAEQSARLAALEEETVRLGEETSAAIAGKELATNRATQAVEAARMAGELAAKAKVEQNERVAKLNAQLEAAASDRRQAEAQAKILADRMAALEVARTEAAERLAALERIRSRTGDSGTGAASGQTEDAEASAIAAKLVEQEAQLEQLREENLALNERTQALVAKQIAAEEAIIAAGGDFHLVGIEVMSPSAKRYMSQRHRARMAAEKPSP